MTERKQARWYPSETSSVQPRHGDYFEGTAVLDGSSNVVFFYNETCTSIVRRTELEFYPYLKDRIISALEQYSTELGYEAFEMGKHGIEDQEGIADGEAEKINTLIDDVRNAIVREA